MKPILRFDGAVRRDPAIDTWISGRPAAFRGIAQEWFARMRQCGEDVTELLHDGCPTVCVGDVPFAYVHTFTNHANVGFFQGATLKDPSHILEGNGKYMRHVKLRPGSPVPAQALTELIELAYRDARARAAK